MSAEPRVVDWIPRVGDSTKRFVSGIEYLNQEGRNRILSETSRVLSRCSNPNELVGKRTVLVAGEVQSGKTLSFTTLMTLARDNGIQIIVLLAGTKKNLLDQSLGRLIKDLRVEDGAAFKEWKVFKNAKQADASEILTALKTWKDPKVPADFRKSIILVALKNPTGIRHVKSLLATVLNESSAPLNVIIVDDEADQASLNLVKKSKLTGSREGTPFLK